MFCNKCGAQLAEGSVFCHKCGTKNEIVDENPKEIIQSTSNVTQLATNLEKTDMLAYGRVESENDKATNYTLFTLFSKLITPLKAYEAINKKINNEKKKLEDIKDTGFFVFFLYSIIPFLVASVCLVIFLNIVIDFIDLSSIREFDNYYNSLSKEEKNEYLNAFRVSPKSENIPRAEQEKNIKYHIFIKRNNSPRMIKLLKFLKTEQSNGYYLYRSSLNIARALYDKLIPVILAIWVWCLILLTKSNKKHKNKQREEVSLRIENDIKKQQEMLQILNQFIIYIPPNYRNSDAVAFFYDAYSNTKVDNLKEAINLYDTQQRHYEVIDNLYALQTEMMMTSAQLQQMNNKMNLLAAEIFVTAFI